MACTVSDDHQILVVAVRTEAVQSIGIPARVRNPRDGRAITIGVIFENICVVGQI